MCAQGLYISNFHRYHAMKYMRQIFALYAAETAATQMLIIAQIGHLFHVKSVISICYDIDANKH